MRIDDTPSLPLTPKLTLQLNEALLRFHNPAFIATDPMQLPHRYRNDPQRCELACLMAALMAYGQRKVIITTLHKVWELLDDDPLQALQSETPKQLERRLKPFVYRFYKGADWAWLLGRLNLVYQAHGSLEHLFIACCQNEKLDTLQKCLAAWVWELTENPAYGAVLSPVSSYGAGYLLPRPEKGGLCKRLHLFLRWVVRHDDALDEPVDFGLWRQALSPAQLIMPVDTHVGRLAVEYGLSPSLPKTWQDAERLTQALAQLRPHDPLAYDFAFMGLGTMNAS
jgi:uncharacterized protein (TIGR02757 family)